MLITRAFFWMAQSMPRIRLAVVPPSTPSTRMGITRQPGATPAIPTPLLARAAMIPATCVP
ncbi:hypothetical protein D3C86_1160200 [compost metagenome]